MKHLIIQGKTCPTCQGNYKTKNPAYAEFWANATEEEEDNPQSYYCPDEYKICSDCNKGVVRTEEELGPIMYEMLQSMIKNDRIRFDTTIKERSK